MQAYILVGPTAIDAGGGGGGGSSTNRNLILHSINHGWTWGAYYRRPPRHHHHHPTITASATNTHHNLHQQNHYDVLGVAADASPSHIKKAYRHLALKYHPDVSKDSGADETFKRIRLAYDILSNEATRNQYDRSLRYEKDKRRPLESSWDYSRENEDELRIYRWAYLKRKTQWEKYWQQNQSKEKRYSFYDEAEKVSEEVTEDEERGSFVEVLKSAFLSLFLMHTVGIRLSLTFSSLVAFLDQKLDAGYKIGYFVAWLLGGKGGIMLTLCLSFASWVCGKTSSSPVALTIVAMLFCSNLARFAPLPQGALLTLLYMSIKLQVDLN